MTPLDPRNRTILGFILIVFAGAVLTVVYWPLLAVAGILGGYLMDSFKKSFSAFIAGILSWALLLSPYLLSGSFGAVNAFMSSVAGLPAAAFTVVIGGILALLGALIGSTISSLVR
jgi:hypothetical protein